jgi:hypothetical protein
MLIFLVLPFITASRFRIPELARLATQALAADRNDRQSINELPHPCVEKFQAIENIFNR